MTLMTRQMDDQLVLSEQLHGHVGDYDLGRLISRQVHGDIHKAYDAENEYLLKLAREPGANPKVNDEARILESLVSDPKVREQSQAYFPQLLDRVSFSPVKQPEQSAATDILYGDFSRNHDPDAEEIVQAGYLFAAVPGLVSLRQVKEAFPDGLDPKDMVWIYRRLLMALGFVSAAGLSHGAVFPENIFIQPEMHGVVLGGWDLAAKTGEEFHYPTAYADQEHKDFLPMEAGPLSADPKLDIYMATMSMRWITDPDKTPKKLWAFFRGCLALSEQHRPDDAWELKDELDVLLENLWGRRRFRPFVMPDVADEDDLQLQSEELPEESSIKPKTEKEN